MKIIKRFVNQEDGTEAVVAEISLGISVTLRDTDADMSVGWSRIFKDEASAMAYAQTIYGS